MIDVSKIFVCSGRVCGWEEDETKFVEADSIGEAEVKFANWLRSVEENDADEEVYINFLCAASNYREHLV